MNKLDKDYQNLLRDILQNGTKKQDRTGTGTLSVFGRQLRHDFRDGFPLLTTKRMAFKQIVTELIWFLRGDTNIKFLVDNGCHIWDGDAYQAYLKKYEKDKLHGVIYENDETQNRPFSKEEFINWVKNNDKFSELYGELGPVYGRMWRAFDEDADGGIDQITNLINDLKTNPDSRRLLVTAWNPTYLPHQVLPPCHYGFQVYTRELSASERITYKSSKKTKLFDSHELYNFIKNNENVTIDLDDVVHKECDELNIPRRAISLMWNQRSVDTFLGLPFNIASYGLLLEIIAKAVNMVPDELIGNLGDVHLYTNHIEQAKEQIGRDYTLEERLNMVSEEIQKEFSSGTVNLSNFPNTPVWSDEGKMSLLDDFEVPRRTRQPFPLPTLNINTEFWPYEGGECGVGPLDAIKVFEAFKNDNFCRCLLEEDIQLGNYQSHQTIKAPLSN